MKENETKETVNPEEKKASLLSGIFTSRESAEDAMHLLQQKGYNHAHIHVFMSDKTHKKHFSNDKHAPNFDTHTVKADPNMGMKTKEGAETGAAVGIGLGAMAGAIAAMGTSLLIPGLGIFIAGSFLAGIAGAGAGALTGGLIGAFIGAGIPEDHARAYEHGIKNGHIVLGVNPLNAQDAVHIESEWTKHPETKIYKVY